MDFIQSAFDAMKAPLVLCRAPGYPPLLKELLQAQPFSAAPAGDISRLPVTTNFWHKSRTVWDAAPPWPQNQPKTSWNHLHNPHGLMFWIDLDMRYWEFARPSIKRFKKQEIIGVRMWEKNVNNIQAQTLRTVRLWSDRMSWRSSFARACQAQYLWIWL